MGVEHNLPVRVYYEDTDFTGVVYHASYLRFLERGRTDALRLMGVMHSALLAQPDPAAFAVTRLAIDFVAAARIDDALLVRTSFEAVSGPRLFINQSIVRGDDLIARAKVEAACVALGGRARRPPAALRNLIRPYLAGGDAS
jgi:acyl-CoA thioester hydrolase